VAAADATFGAASAVMKHCVVVACRQENAVVAHLSDVCLEPVLVKSFAFTIKNGSRTAFGAPSTSRYTKGSSVDRTYEKTCSHRPSLFRLFQCLSRAYLGKVIVFCIYVAQKEAFFAPQETGR
jgi:hypothetical protein